MRNDADGLDILLFAETGSDDAAKPFFAQAAGVGPYPMRDFDHDLGQSAQAIVLTLDRGRRQRLFAPTAQRAREGMAGPGPRPDPLAPLPPSPRLPHPSPRPPPILR